MKPEPRRTCDVNSLWPPFRDRVNTLLERMRERGFDPVVFEARRTRARQEWLYGFGRTHHLAGRPVTWTLRSRHLVGKAADIVSRSRGWRWPAFYRALKEEAASLGLKVLSTEGCHVEWQG